MPTDRLTFTGHSGDTLAARGMAPGLLIGHSLCGAGVLAAARIESVRVVVAVGAPPQASTLGSKRSSLSALDAAERRAPDTAMGFEVLLKRGVVDRTFARARLPPPLGKGVIKTIDSVEALGPLYRIRRMTHLLERPRPIHVISKRTLRSEHAALRQPP